MKRQRKIMKARRILKKVVKTEYRQVTIGRNTYRTDVVLHLNNGIILGIYVDQEGKFKAYYDSSSDNPKPFRTYRDILNDRMTEILLSVAWPMEPYR